MNDAIKIVLSRIHKLGLVELEREVPNLSFDELRRLHAVLSTQTLVAGKTLCLEARRAEAEERGLCADTDAPECMSDDDLIEDINRLEEERAELLKWLKDVELPASVQRALAMLSRGKM